MTKRVLFLTATAVSALTLSACSLINPHVRVADTIRYPASNTENAVQRTLPHAVRYADQQLKAYQDAIDDRATLTSLMGIGLIPLSAAALGVGATGGSAETLLALGLGGAAAYGTGSWLNSKPDQFAYKAGAVAIVCAQQALAPLIALPPSVPGKVSMYTYGFDDTGAGDGTVPGSDIPPLASSIVAAEGKIAGMKVIYARLSDKDRAFVADEKELLDDAEGAVASAEQVRVKGSELVKATNQAGANLFSAVDKIVNAVDGALIGNSPELTSLPGLIGGLAAMSKGFGNTTDLLAPKPKTPEKPAGPSDFVPLDNPQDVQDFIAASKELEDLSGKAVVSAHRVAMLVDLVDTTKIGSLDGCGVNPQDLAPALSILPTETTKRFKNSAASTQTITIQNGRPPYSAALMESAPKGLSIVAPMLGGNAVTIVVEKDAVKGTSHLLIADSAGQHILVNIVIE